ncbi:MAG: tetratricopeptide repeat protein [SAR324 cluster bacterium]|nr:tetratricopeptide repeat protein [SAR324 cluster bacterium]
MAEMDDVLVQDGGQKMTPDGQVMLPLTPAPPLSSSLDSVNTCRANLHQNPEDATALFDMAFLLRQLGQFKEAESYYQKAVTQDTDRYEAWYSLADVLDEQHRLGEAIQCLQRSLEINPHFADAHFKIASCLERVGRHPDARNHWQAYLQLDTSGEWADLSKKHLRLLPQRNSPFKLS